MRKAGLTLFGCILLSGCSSGGSDGREQLTLALGSKTLPASVKNIHFGEDAWTDYNVHVYCELDPADFQSVLAGRPLVKSEFDHDPYKIDPPNYASSIPVFTAVETYRWDGGGLASCELVTSEQHDRIYVVYGTD